MNFRPIMVFKSGERAGNALVFSTRDEAQASADALLARWFVPVAADVEETSAPVNYRRENGGDTPAAEISKEDAE